MSKGSKRSARAASLYLSQSTPSSKRQKPNGGRNLAGNKMSDVTADVLGDPVDYSDFKAWIAQQEAFPTPLTQTQHRALADLRDSFMPRTDVGDKDWVSLLHRYRDAHQHFGVKVEFHEDVQFQKQWMCQLTFKSAVLDEQGLPTVRRFPDLDCGFIPIGSDGSLRQPTFQRKKDARKYAAKCCVEFLMENSWMPSDGISVAFRRPPPPPPMPKKKSDSQRLTPPVFSQNTISGSSSSSHLSNGSPTTAGKSQPAKEQEEEPSGSGGGAPIDVRDDDISAIPRVLEMCNRLGIHPPTYNIVQADNPTANFFNGSPDFGIDNVQIPESVGRVVNCFSKRFTKEKVAEEVLDYLLSVEAKRNAVADALLLGLEKNLEAD